MMGEDFLFGGLRPGSGLVSPWRAGALSLIKSLVGENLARETGLGKGRARPGGRALGVVSRGVAESRPGEDQLTGSRICTLLPRKSKQAGLPKSPDRGGSPHSLNKLRGTNRDRGKQHQPGPPGPRYGELSS